MMLGARPPRLEESFGGTGPMSKTGKGACMNAMQVNGWCGRLTMPLPVYVLRCFHGPQRVCLPACLPGTPGIKQVSRNSCGARACLAVPPVVLGLFCAQLLAPCSGVRWKGLL